MSAALVAALAAGGRRRHRARHGRFAGRSRPRAGARPRAGPGRWPGARRAGGSARGSSGRASARPRRLRAVGAAALAAAALPGACCALPLLAPAAAGAVIVGARARWCGSADRRHLARVERQLPGVAQQLAAAIGAGLSLRQALPAPRGTRPSPSAASWRGRGSWRWAPASRRRSRASRTRLPAHDLRIMVTAILVQRRTGGNLARALGDPGRLEERAQLGPRAAGRHGPGADDGVAGRGAARGGRCDDRARRAGDAGGFSGRGPGPALLVASATLYAGGSSIRRIGRVEP